MRAEDFEYPLPADLIAQEPVRPRDSSRLLVLHRDTGAVEHRRFRQIVEYLRPNDLAVFNDTRVIAARLIGEKAGTGGRVEALLLREREPDVWEAAVKPGRRIRPGARLVFGEGALTGEVVGYAPGGRLIRFHAKGDLQRALRRAGEIPLPPYIHQPLRRPEEYQTILARVNGSSAAPTAGLHFTPRVLKALQERGVALAFTTLHIGLATFRPIRAGNVEDHDMHAEYCVVPRETVEAIRAARGAGGRILAVGTTTVRALESAAQGGLKPFAGETTLYITPGYRFQVIDALLTNFHMPRSTLLVLLCAFAGRERVLSAYREAVERRYRFLSFGDAMLVL